MGNVIDENNFNCTETANEDIEKEMVNCETQIGFTSQSYHKMIFIILSLLGLILGIILFIDFLVHKIKRLKRNKNRTLGSMKLYFRILTIINFISSLYWFLSSIALSKAKDIKNNNLCKPLSFVYVFLFIFNLYFICCTLRHFSQLNLNPIDSIFKPRESLIKDLIIGLIITIIVTLIALFTGALGKSPMNTCFINTEQNYSSIIVYIAGFIFILIILYQIIKGLYFSKMFVNDDMMHSLYAQNSCYALIFCGFHIPMIILLLITSFRHKNIVESETGLTLFSYFSTILLYVLPPLLGGLSVYQGMVNVYWLKKRRRKRNVSHLTDVLNPELSLSLTINDQYSWLDKHAMESFMKNILLGIAICVKKSKNIKIPNKFDKSDFFNSVKYEVNFKNYNLYGIDAYDVNSEDYLDIKIIEYAPACFSYLRELEFINVDEMIKSFLPNNNKQGMKKSAGKSGSFFISTDDQQYMIKTLKKEEFDLIRNSFLKKYINYIKDHPKSLICRIYGVYSLIQYGGTEVFVIVMRNVIGSLKDNIVAKFDLKGSTINREIKSLDMSKIDNGVMKDVNFNDIEFGIMVNNHNIKKINYLAQTDSKFLLSLDLMDYSLFVVKLSLNKDEIKEIFGERIQEEIEQDYMDVITDKTVMINTTANANINDYIISNAPTKGSLQITDSKYQHYKHYLFPGLNLGTAYIISIIDFLQSYNFSKIVENKFKTNIKGRKSDVEGGISCVEPKLYSERFINYVKHLTEVKHILVGNKSDSE